MTERHVRYPETVGEWHQAAMIECVEVLHELLPETVLEGTETWIVVVVRPDGRADSGTYTYPQGSVVQTKRLADSLADMTWRIVNDMAWSDQIADLTGEEG
jgi:hypothetical protein